MSIFLFCGDFYIMSEKNTVCCSLEKKFYVKGIDTKVVFEQRFCTIVRTIISKNRTKSEKLMRSYVISYPSMIDYFQKYFLNDDLSFIRGTFLVYAWMPTGFRYNKGNVVDEDSIQEIKNFLRKVQNVNAEKVLDELKSDEGRVLSKIVEMMNDSVVGMSKLLHFVNPAVFPIYDSNMGDALKFKCTVENYIDYVKGFAAFCDQVIDGKNWSCDMTPFCENFGYPADFKITPLRAVELTLFASRKIG